MTEQLEAPTQNHFIDLYNRKIVLEGMSQPLAREHCGYLDVGCSSGYMLKDVLAHFPNVQAMGADYFPAGLFQCHQRLPDVPLFQMDLTCCQFPNDLFDAISCLNVLEHLQEDDLAIRQLYRIVKPGGIIVITVPTMPGLYDMHDEAYGHLRRYDLNDLKKKISAAGFKIVRANYFGVFLYPVFYAIKKMTKIRSRETDLEEKKRKAFVAIRATERCHFLEYLCELERMLGKQCAYPLGVRGYVIAEK